MKNKYHNNAQYIDCALENKEYCNKCGWTKTHTYRIVSPDGIDISATKQLYKQSEVRKAIQDFANKYKEQGYYSQTCYNGYKRQIAVSDIPDYCEVIEVN